MPLKGLYRKCKSEYQRSNCKNLVNARDNPKLFWNIIKKSNSTARSEESVLHSSKWVEYFSDLLINLRLMIASI